MAAPSKVRKGRFALSLDGGTTLLSFDCDPTAVTITPSAGDTGDAIEALCGDTVPGDAGPTTWTLAITSLQRLAAAETDQTSLVLWALENDGAQATYWFQPSSATHGGTDTKIFTGSVTVVALPIGGEAGPTAPTSDIEWPSEKPTIAATWPPGGAGLAAKTTEKTAA